MIGFVVAAAQEVVARAPIVSTDSLWLAGGGAVGAFARALWTRGQRNLGAETAVDVFLGFMVGLLWTVPLFGVWPPFELSAGASQVQRAGLIALFAMVGIEAIKQLLIRVAPAYLQKLGAQVSPVPNGPSASPTGAPKNQ